MTDQPFQGFMMIGLHKLAAQNGDGLVPELYDLLTENAARRELYPNVMEFPVWEARQSGEIADRPLGDEAANGDNVVAFPKVRAKGRKT
ncbi:hypothetical protein HGP14_24845 [Rhizobium sp. P32RR-XVIII]|uniref:hypothetical protein n=1 Tax=Rhizobium sp. P32RR-XVIII TaxID=2726738 RepID=UPI0014575D6F|nr:hypothetical protein [Rhizobium sp. P32RR-XVIII]NLS06541.1 hypothetical protein [Rhizobium sp. P32RR-XVIII]